MKKYSLHNLYSFLRNTLVICVNTKYLVVFRDTIKNSVYCKRYYFCNVYLMLNKESAIVSKAYFLLNQSSIVRIIILILRVCTNAAVLVLFDFLVIYS